MIAHKTKATMPGRQCSTENKEHNQHTRLVAGGQSLSAPVITGTAPMALSVRLSLSGAAISKIVGCVLRRGYTALAHTPSPQIWGELAQRAGCTALQHTPYLNHGRGCEPMAHITGNSRSFYPDFGYRTYTKSAGQTPELESAQPSVVMVEHSTTFAASCECGSGQSFLSSFNQLYPALTAHTIKITIIQLKIALGVNILYSSDLALVCFLWRRLISPSKAVTTNCPVLSPGSFNCSIAPAMSCGTLAAIVCDLRLIALVAMLIYSKKGVQQYGRNKKSVQHLTCSTPLHKLVFNTLYCLNTNTAKPGSVTSTNRASYHQDS